jgi:hypothetical protein
MGQMLEDFGEKRKNIILSEMGRKNKMATGGSPSALGFADSISPPPHPTQSWHLLTSLAGQAEMMIFL